MWWRPGVCRRWPCQGRRGTRTSCGGTRERIPGTGIRSTPNGKAPVPFRGKSSAGIALWIDAHVVLVARIQRVQRAAIDLPVIREGGKMQTPLAIQLYEECVKGKTPAQLSAETGITVHGVLVRVLAAMEYFKDHVHEVSITCARRRGVASSATA